MLPKNESGKLSAAFVAASFTDLIEEVSDLVCIVGIIDLPQSTRQLVHLPHPSLGDAVTSCFIYCPYCCCTTKSRVENGKHNYQNTFTSRLPAHNLE